MVCQERRDLHTLMAIGTTYCQGRTDLHTIMVIGANRLSGEKGPTHYHGSRSQWTVKGEGTYTLSWQ